MKPQLSLTTIVNKLPKPVSRLLFKYQKAWGYAIIGIIGLWVDLGGFYYLYNFAGLDKSLANLISSALAIFHNFVLNAIFNFQKRDRLPLRLLSFYAVGIVGILITQLMFWIFTDTARIDANIIKPISVIVVFIVQFNLNKYFSFR